MIRPGSSLSGCAALVRRHDPDRYVATLFASPDRREPLFALYAFGAELARVPKRVSEPMLGAIRLQWWRESLDGITAGTPRRHEVVGPLAQAVSRHSLDMAPLRRAIEAWEAEMEREGQPTLYDIEGLAEGAAKPLDEAAFTLLDVPLTDARDEALRHGSLAVGLTALLRGVAARASDGRAMLPRDVLTRHGLDLGTMLDGDRDRRLAAATSELAGRARGHVEAVRRLLPAVPRRARFVLLPVSFAERDLARLRRKSHDLFEAFPGDRGLVRLLPVVVRGLTGRV